MPRKPKPDLNLTDNNILTSAGLLELLHNMGMTDLTIRSIDQMCANNSIPFVKHHRRRIFYKPQIIEHFERMFHAII